MYINTEYWLEYSFKPNWFKLTKNKNAFKDKIIEGNIIKHFGNLFRLKTENEAVKDKMI